MYTQDEKALHDAAARGDVSAVKQLIASNVNVDCTPYEVCVYCEAGDIYMNNTFLPCLIRVAVLYIVERLHL